MSNYTITEEQIKSIALGGGKTKIKEMFPEVFEPKETIETFLDAIFNKDLTCKVELQSKPNSVFYFDGDTLLLEIEKTETKLYAHVNYDKIWKPISSKFNMDDSQTQQILKNRIEQHFKFQQITPELKIPYFQYKIEEDFKLRQGKPDPQDINIGLWIKQNFFKK